MPDPVPGTRDGKTAVSAQARWLVTPDRGAGTGSGAVPEL